MSSLVKNPITLELKPVPSWIDATRAPDMIAAYFGYSSVATLIDFGNRKESPIPAVTIIPSKKFSLLAEGNMKKVKATRNGAMIYRIRVEYRSAMNVKRTLPMVIPAQNNERPIDALANESPPSFSKNTAPKFPKVASQAP